ncbi:MAG: hypothetical protein AABY07_06330, partial [Nanoarchaeota archaeon]
NLKNRGGRPIPMPLGKILTIYFQPKDKIFIGSIGCYPFHMTLQAPGVGLLICEEGGRNHRQLAVQSKVVLDYYDQNRDFRITRPEALGNLELLLGFIPKLHTLEDHEYESEKEEERNRINKVILSIGNAAPKY